MTDGSVRRRVFVIGSGFCPARIFRYTIVARADHACRAVAVSLTRDFFTISRTRSPKYRSSRRYFNRIVPSCVSRFSSRPRVSPGFLLHDRRSYTRGIARASGTIIAARIFTTKIAAKIAARYKFGQQLCSGDVSRRISVCRDDATACTANTRASRTRESAI